MSGLALNNLRPVVAGGLAEKAGPVQYSAALRITGSEDKASHTGHGNCSRTHGAGLKGYIQRGTNKALVAQATGGLADDLDLGMGGRVVTLEDAVAVHSQHGRAVGGHENCANRYLLAFCGALGLS